MSELHCACQLRCAHPPALLCLPLGHAGTMTVRRWLRDPMPMATCGSPPLALSACHSLLEPFVAAVHRAMCTSQTVPPLALRVTSLKVMSKIKAREQIDGSNTTQQDEKGAIGPRQCASPYFFRPFFFCCCLEPAPELLAAACCFSAAAATAAGRPLTRPGCRGTSSATLTRSALPASSRQPARTGQTGE